MRIREMVEHELEITREKRRAAESAIDAYEKSAHRACRRGQALHVEDAVNRYCERVGIYPLIQKERALEEELAEFDRAPMGGFLA